MVMKPMLLKTKVIWNIKACKNLKILKFKIYCIFYRPEMSNLRYFYKFLMRL